jgi:energy-coupling factor transport system permease protein
VQLLRATTAGVLDRALDVAATLEVRGYGSAQRPRRSPGPPWSRHDLAFAASAVGLAALAVFSRVAGWVPFSAYPLLRAPAGARVLLVGVLMLFGALAPFVDRRGISR